MTNINPRGEPFIYAVLATCGHLLLMEGFMLLVVQFLKNAMLSVTFAMVIMGYLFLFSGFFIKVSDMPTWISWISYITPTKVRISDILNVISSYSVHDCLTEVSHVYSVLFRRVPVSDIPHTGV